MNNFFKPTILSLILTFKCSAKCDNCCFECNPYRNEKLSVKQAKSYIDSAVNNFPSIKVVVLTGGECMLYTEEAIQIISHVHSYGLICRIVTNGFWAKNKTETTEIMKRLKHVGLNEINFSTGDEHLQYVPIENIKNGIITALHMGMTTVVNIETGKDRIYSVKNFLSDDRLIKCIAKHKGMFSIVNGMWMPFTEEALAFLPPLDSKVHNQCMDRCTNLFSAITISPTNKMLGCCGLPVLYIKYLELGDLHLQDMKSLYNNQFNDFLKIWLYVEGPYKILSFVAEKLGEDNVPELKKLSHICFYCACLFTNPNYLNIIKKCYKERYASVMMRYEFMLKQNN